MTFTVGNRHGTLDYKAPGIGWVTRQSDQSEALMHLPNIGGNETQTTIFSFDQWRIDIVDHVHTYLDGLDPEDIRSTSPAYDRRRVVQAVATWARTELGYLDTGHQDISRALHHAAAFCPTSNLQIRGTTAHLNAMTLHASEVRVTAPAATAQVSLHVTNDRTGKVVDSTTAAIGPDAVERVSRWIVSGGQRVNPPLSERLAEQAHSAFNVIRGRSRDRAALTTAGEPD